VGGHLPTCGGRPCEMATQSRPPRGPLRPLTADRGVGMPRVSGR
jgi:hypothetical protein